MCEQDNCSIPYGFCHCGCGGKTSIAKWASAEKGWAKGEPKRFMNNHYAKNLIGDLYVPKDHGHKTPCWIWTGMVHPKTGYGQYTGRPPERLAHRAVYAVEKGPIPDGLELDHLCRVRACVNPDHLEPVTHAENSRRSPLLTKLNWEAIDEIRSSESPINELAAQFEVSRSCIGHILAERSWKPSSR